ncbi:hypothetical protein K490DRAFT_55330 [Saccharata proteae CBS 121410]|uniref:Uncharacterized protein n=1 Tax=Saccharata proteae CBS 121410 TaxID=1314787 RepID=A0A6A5YFR0_9PEZI|nr:hypothetical protein K490DRAFT_55330 [Saccharata proteae CBS 121410]
MPPVPPLPLPADSHTTISMYNNNFPSLPHLHLHPRTTSMTDTTGSLSDWAIALWALLFLFVLAVVVSVTLRWTRPTTNSNHLPWYHHLLSFPSLDCLNRRNRHRANNKLSWYCAGAFPTTSSYSSHAAGGTGDRATKSNGWWSKIFNFNREIVPRRGVKASEITHETFSLRSPGAFSITSTPHTPLTPWTRMPVAPGSGPYQHDNSQVNNTVGNSSNGPQLPASAFNPAGPNFSRPGNRCSGLYTPNAITHARVWSQGSNGGIIKDGSLSSQRKEYEGYGGIEMGVVNDGGRVAKPGAAKLGGWV